MISHYKFNELGNQDFGWLNARYHFNFANYYNPKLKPKNPLIVWNDDTIKSQTGFPMHSHQNMEIITYIRKGSITHKDSFGNLGEIKTGQMQVMSAGTGITHSEYNLSDVETLLFQIWIEPNRYNLPPKWETMDLSSKSNEKISILASGKENYENLDILRINQDASVIKISNNKNQTLNYEFNKERHAYFVLSRGKILINGIEINERDGVHLSKLKHFNIDFMKSSEIIFVDLPLMN
tara:strand:- start:34 stop:744 length:711 start_codon:yes stop_codon:yes gene_type:complete